MDLYEQKDGPLVSIGIPTFNRARFLEKSILTLLQQYYQNLEIIISDNSSNDETYKIAKKFQAIDSRISYFRQDSNIGPIANFEFVRNHSSGKYFMWHADDDLLGSKDYIHQCVSELESNEKLVLVSGIPKYSKQGRLAYYGKRIQLDYESNYCRVLGYFSNVSDNGIFYGLYRASVITKCKTPNCLGSDWAWMAEVAFLGKVKTLQSVSIQRELGGASDSYKRIVSLLGLPSWHAVLPWLAVSSGLFRHMVSSSRVFSELPFPCRTLLWFCISSVLLARRMIGLPVTIYRSMR